MIHSTTSWGLLALVAWSAIAWGGLKVEIEGLSGELLKNARAYLTLERLASRREFEEKAVRRAYRLAEREIREALQAFGYYHPEIRGKLERRGGDWVARFVVQSGPPIRIASVDFRILGKGEDDPAFRAFSFPLKAGDILRHDRYEEAKRRLQALAVERGYFDAGFTEHRIEVDLERNEARVALHFYTGPRYRFGPVIFHQKGFDEDFLTRFIPFSRDEPYTYSKLIAFQEALVKSGYFTSVDVHVGKERAQGREVPIDVTLVPVRRFKFSFGLGYATDTGFRGSLGFENRRVNKRGHRLKGTSLVSQKGEEINLDYEIPGKRPLIERWLLGTGLKDERTESATSRLFTLGVRRSQSRLGWLETLSLDLRREIFEVGGERGESTLVLPGGEWTRTRADDPLYPRRGQKITLGLRGTGTALGASTQFLQAYGQARFIRPLGEGRLLLRGEAGASLVAEFAQLPASLRFFAGGDQSVRGYAYRSLGPEEDGQVVGGRHLLVGSVEYEHPVRKGFGVAAFYDVGNALDKLGNPLKQGAGFGLRWRSPVGPLRLDFAFALSEPGAPFRLHFRMGPAL